MHSQNLYVVTGPNAAGKSSFIRSRLNDFYQYEIIMTDVYKQRTKDIFYDATSKKKGIVLETVFNDSSFKSLIEHAKKAGYKTSLIILFLNNSQQLCNRVAIRSLEQDGLLISKGNVDASFNENFKNIVYYHYYFDQAVFIHTGIKGKNETMMTLKALEIENYRSNNHKFVAAFAQFAYQNDRLNDEAFKIISDNIDFNKEVSP